jgi:hypothetical protein
LLLSGFPGPAPGRPFLAVTLVRWLKTKSSGQVLRWRTALYTKAIKKARIILLQCV